LIMNRIAILLGSGLSLSGVLLLSAGPAQAQASACNAEIMHVQEQWRSAPISASRSYIKPSTTSISSAGARPLATSSPTRLGSTIGEDLGKGPSAGPGEFQRSAHAVPHGSPEVNPPGALPQFRGYNVTTPSGAVMRGGSNPDEVAAALARAQAASQAGDYVACMNAVREAQRFLQ
jgi:hypothetical protein